MGFIVAYSFIFWSRILTHLTEAVQRRAEKEMKLQRAYEQLRSEAAR
jgi:hypothetical protein